MKKTDADSNKTVRSPRAEHAKLRNKAEVGDKIRAFRKKKGLSQPELASILGTTKNSITNWEAGTSRPEFAMIPKLCRALDITADGFFGLSGTGDSLSPAERSHLAAYRRLNTYQQSSVDALIASMIDNERRAFFDHCERNITRIERRPAAAAGVGSPISELSEPEYVWLHNDRNVLRADAVIPVNGDSMLPTFADGDELLVEYANEIAFGEIGIFIIGDEGYVKEYRPDGLHSHNSAYETIDPDREEGFRCVGRVLGIAAPEMRATPEEQAALEEICAQKDER